MENLNTIFSFVYASLQNMRSLLFHFSSESREKMSYLSSILSDCQKQENSPIPLKSRDLGTTQCHSVVVPGPLAQIPFFKDLRDASCAK